MAVIQPFRALRPVPEKAEQVSCVPYDVISVDEAREIIEHNPLSFLRVTRPEGDSSGNASTAEQFNAAARDHLEQLVADGVLITESEPAVYIYRLDTGSHSQTGIVACCSLDEYANGRIKRHEKTRPDKVKDRTNHMIAVGAQTGLIFLAHRGTAAIREIVAAEVSGEPLYDFKCEKGVRQTVWKVRKTDELVAAFGEVPTIYIADGHHRAESALRAREVLKAKDPNHTGAEEYNFVIAGIFPAEDLKILPYNRVVRDLNGLSDEEFMARLSENFVTTGTGKDTPENHGEICVYLSGTWHTLKFAVDYIREPDPIERLDVSILQNYILAPILGVGDPRTDERIGFIGGSRGTKELVNLVDNGDARVAFSMFATTMADLLSVSDADEIMPPKSTWFEPKLKDGLLIHTI